MTSSSYRQNQFIAAGLSVALLAAAVSCSGEKVSSVHAGHPATSTVVPAGGQTTIISSSSAAFSTPAPNLTADELARHMTGDAEFEATFVAAPSKRHGGLGPHFNNASCIACHVRDGRGRPDRLGGARSSLVIRASLPGTGPHGGSIAVPGFGTQITDRAVFNVKPEANIEIEWPESAFIYPDGSQVMLRRPVIHLKNTHHPLPAEVLLSARVAPPVFGRGLLEAVPEEVILGLADPDDENGDGISGRANWVWNPETGQTKLGRFGLKANTPTLNMQTAAAYFNDMGITSPLFPDPHSPDAEPEVDQATIEDVTFYVQTLAVPARRNLDDPVVLHGERIFHQAQCTACHSPHLTTAALAGVPAVSHQRIAPYSDMLLHDMGPGLADGRPDFLASGQEWRTPPLWGIGLTPVVSGHSFYLHDGRARSIEEAILWHDGEAAAARDRFTQFSSTDREALIRFIKSL